MKILFIKVFSLFILFSFPTKCVKYTDGKQKSTLLRYIACKKKPKFYGQWKTRYGFMNPFLFLNKATLNSMFPFYSTKRGTKYILKAKGKFQLHQQHSLESTALERTIIKDVFKINISEHAAKKKIKICGWIKSLRKIGKSNFAFLDVNDGSYFHNLQIIVSNNISNFEKILKTSTDEAIECVGELKPSIGGKQKVELSIEDHSKGHYVRLFQDEVQQQNEIVKPLETFDRKGETGEWDEIEGNEKGADEKGADEKGTFKRRRDERRQGHITGEKEYYAISKKYHTKQYLRNFPHLRGRTKLYSSLFRFKSDFILKTFEFFKKKKFTYINTPILTSSDCEGGGKIFHATTLLTDAKNPKRTHDICCSKEGATTIQHIEEKMNNNKHIFDLDFFKTPCYLNVSSQLALECLCCSLGNVFTLNHCFRADNSNTSRHLSEFLMLEIEMAFANLKDIIAIAEEYITEMIHFALYQSEEIQYLTERHNPDIKNKLEQVLSKKFVTLTYDEVIHILQKEQTDNNISDIIWGKDLTVEQQKFLTNKYLNSPLIIIHYPKSIKPFYMKINEDKKTVACMDVIFPHVGEIIGGSEREIRLPVLQNNMKEANLNTKVYAPYIQLRKYGNMPHAGFGLGIDRLIMYITSIDNIRDVVPFPRYPNYLFM